MKKTLPLILLSFSAFGAHLPEFSQGEIKINYPCGTESLIPKNKEEKEVITFFERGNNELYQKGYILRRRVGEGESDFTIKYRSEDSFRVDRNHYQELLISRMGEFKCEYDFAYFPGRINFGRSCSFKSETEIPIQEHNDFTSMIGKEINGGLSIQTMKGVSVQSINWKVKLKPQEEQENPFNKRPSLEKWTIRGECRLEISGKLSNLSQETVEAGFRFLRRLVPEAPSPAQGSKTSWVLGVKH